MLTSLLRPFPLFEISCTNEEQNSKHLLLQLKRKDLLITRAWIALRWQERGKRDVCCLPEVF